jgi:hypothetical protein
VLLNPTVLVISGLSDVLGAIRRILLSYLVHMHSCLRFLRQGQVHVGPITWEVLPYRPLPKPFGAHRTVRYYSPRAPVCGPLGVDYLVVPPDSPVHTGQLGCVWMEGRGRMEMDEIESF